MIFKLPKRYLVADLKNDEQNAGFKTLAETVQPGLDFVYEVSQTKRLPRRKRVIRMSTSLESYQDMMVPECMEKKSDLL